MSLKTSAGSITGRAGQDGRSVLRLRGTPSARHVLLVQRLAPGATNGKGQRPEPLFRDLDVAHQTVSILARLDPADGLVEAAERFGLALEEREVDVLLGSRLGDLADITHLGRSASAAVAHAALHLQVYLAATVFQQPPQLRASHVGHVSLLRYAACGIAARSVCSFWHTCDFTDMG